MAQQPRLDCGQLLIFHPSPLALNCPMCTLKSACQRPQWSGREQVPPSAPFSLEAPPHPACLPVQTSPQLMPSTGTLARGSWRSRNCPFWLSGSISSWQPGRQTHNPGWTVSTACNCLQGGQPLLEARLWPGGDPQGYAGQHQAAWAAQVRTTSASTPAAATPPPQRSPTSERRWRWLA